MTKAVPAGASNRDVAPSRSAWRGVSSATRTFCFISFGSRGGNRYTDSGATAVATVAVSSVASHQPRNVRLVGSFDDFSGEAITHATTGVHYMRSDDVELDLSVVHTRWDLRQIRGRGLQSVIEDLARPAERGLVAGTVELAVGVVGLKLAAEMRAHSRHSGDGAAVVDDHRVQRRGRHQ